MGFAASSAPGHRESIEEVTYRLSNRLLLHLYRPGVDPIDDIRALMGHDVDGLIIANDGDVTADVIRQIADMSSPVRQSTAAPPSGTSKRSRSVVATKREES